MTPDVFAACAAAPSEMDTLGVASSRSAAGSAPRFSLREMEQDMYRMHLNLNRIDTSEPFERIALKEMKLIL